MTIISVLYEQRSLPGHVDTYDAIGVTDEFEEVGLYQHHDIQTWFHNGPAGIFVDTTKL